MTPGRRDPIAAAHRQTSPEAVNNLAANVVPLYPVGAWNCGKNGDLKPGIWRAIAETAARLPHLAALAALIIPRMPGRPLVSRNLKSEATSSWSEPLHKALSAGWISCNAADAVNAITIDVDHADIDLLDDLVARGLPAPTYVVVNPRSSNYHATWWLANPVLTGSTAAAQPQRLLRLAQGLLNAALRGDLGYSNVLTKNPFGEWESDQVPPEPVTLCELAFAALGSRQRHHVRNISGNLVELRAIVAALHDQYAEELPTAPRRRQAAVPEQFIGRNCALFDRVRLWAYPRAERDAALLLAQARVFNDFSPPLPESEVRAIARSVAKFMATRFTGTGQDDKNRGVMGLASSGLPLEQKQRLGGQYGAGRRSGKTDDRIIAAAVELRARSGTNPTQAAVAAVSGVSLRSIKRRWPDVLARFADGASQCPSVVAGACPLRPGPFSSQALAFALHEGGVGSGLAGFGGAGGATSDDAAGLPGNGHASSSEDMASDRDVGHPSGSSAILMIDDHQVGQAQAWPSSRSPLTKMAS